MVVFIKSVTLYSFRFLPVQKGVTDLHHDLRSIGMLDSYITTCIVRQRLASLALYRTCAYVHTSTAVVQPEGGAARYKSVLDIAGSFERAHRLALLPLHSSAGRFKMNREERAEYFLI